MSRRVVIGILIFLIISVLGGIAFLVMYNSRMQEGSPTPTLTFSPIPIADPTADSDNDGLTNGDEKTWGTDPSNGDTDQDGYMDGEEVQNSHNPTIASPNDKLPAGFIPNQNATPLDPAAPTTTSFESYFSEEVDLTGGSRNLSQDYASAIPDAQKSPASLNQFIIAQPITTSLPIVNNNAITVTEDSSPLFISQYLSTAGSIDSIADKQRMTIALNDFFENKNAYGFTTLAEAVKSSQSRIQNTPVPKEAANYHKLVIGYTELLAATLNQIGGYQNDQIKALVALRQLDAIDRLYYPLIIEERNRLSNFIE